MLPSRGYFSSISCPFYVSGNCDRPHCHYRHCKTPTKEYDDEEPIPKRLFRIQATLSDEIKTYFEEERIRTQKESHQNYGGISSHAQSGYPSSSSNISANNRPSNGDYYKRHIPVVYAPAKPTIVRRNSLYVPSVPQNSARPSNINYTPSSRPVSNPSSEYKPQSLTLGFYSSASYKPSQNIRQHSDASSYTPRPTGSSDYSVSYTPSTGKTNSDAYYTPSQTGLSYPSASYSPSSTLRTNADALYAPQGAANITASYSPTTSRNFNASYSTNSSSYTRSQPLKTNSVASYSPYDKTKSISDLSYAPSFSHNYVQKEKYIADAQTSPINSPERFDSLADTISSVTQKTSSNELGSEQDWPSMPSDDEIEDDEDEEIDSTVSNEMQVENFEKPKHSKEKKVSKEVENIPDKKKDGLNEKAKKESRREHDKNHSKREETSDSSKRKSKSSSESKEKSSSHSHSKNKVTKEGKCKSDSKDSKTTEIKDKHSIVSEKRIKSESSKDGHKTDKKEGHSSKSDKKEGHSSSKNEKKKHSSSSESSLKIDKGKTNGHSKSSSKSSHHSKSGERHSHKDKSASSSDKIHRPTEKKHSSTSSSSKHRHSSSKSESSRSRHSSSSKEKSKRSSSLKRSSSTEDDLKIKKPKMEDCIILEEDSDNDNGGQVICLGSEDDSSDETELVSNHKEEEAVRKIVETSVENTSVDRWVKARETINRNSQGRVRIAHVPNVSSLLSAKEMIMSRNKNKREITSGTSEEKEQGEPSSDYALPKVSKRVAHTPKDDSFNYPLAKHHDEIKIKLFTRQSCLRNLFDEFVKYICQEEASKMALEEELELAKRMNSVKTYLNSVALLVLKIRKNKGILQKNTGPVVKILSSNSTPSFTYGHTIYKCCLNYLVSDEELKRNGFPRKITGRPGYASFDTTLSNRFPEKQEGPERVCINCNESYMVDDNELPVMNGECVYHWGRIFKAKVGGNWTDYYSCCNRDMMTSGCEMAAFHLSSTFDWTSLGGFVSTSPPPAYTPEDEAGVFALDCEMCHTTRGSELTRCTVIDLNGSIIYDTIVRPDHTILDYCTRFSGITEEIMRKSKTRLADVQARLLKLFNSKTILVGHSLENDLKALRIFHDRIIDTSILFPHKQGFPYKKALKTLTKEFLGREIQVSESGHDSKEDAVACLDLLMYKIKQDSKVRKPRVIISLPS